MKWNALKWCAMFDQVIAVCPVCPHRCRIPEGKVGRCRARGTKDGKVVSLNYPGSTILSYGSYGCSLNCPFCQNWEISMSDGHEFRQGRRAKENYISPEYLADMAERLKPRKNIGVAFTYNEPLISYEYILDTAALLREKNLKVILVTNGCVNAEIADAVLPMADALNIDLKSFQDEVYSKTLGGDLETVKNFIAKAAEQCHVELTSLIVPGMNDSEEEIRSMTQWIASLPKGEDIPLHITRFFPRYRVQDKKPTDKALILRLVEIARQQLKYVYPGNM